MRGLPAKVPPMNVLRHQAPEARSILLVGSLSSGKFSFCLALKLAKAVSLSALAPRMATPAFSNFDFASRNSDASMVQPGVLAFGKKKRKTRLPWKSSSAMSLPSSDFRWKAGALAPGFSMGPPFVNKALVLNLSLGGKAAARLPHSKNARRLRAAEWKTLTGLKTGHYKARKEACGGCRLRFADWPGRGWLSLPGLRRI